MNEKIEVTASLEDYLETIFFLQQKNDTVRITDIAVSLNISKPSVNRAINTLKARGFVDHERYGSLSLTSKGVEFAKNVAHRHNVLIDFLKNTLGVEGSLAEKEACLIEHHISSDTIDKLSVFMKNHK